MVEGSEINLILSVR